MGAPFLAAFARSGVPDGWKLELSWCDPLGPNIRPQGLRNHHTSIGLLIILDNRDPRAANGESAAVQRVHIFRLVLALGPEPDIRPPRLVRLEIRARRNLAIQLLSRQPDLNVIRLR